VDKDGGSIFGERKGKVLKIQTKLKMEGNSLPE
jgi:hypothetical protein